MNTREVTNAIEKLIEIKLVERFGGLPLSQGEVKERLEEAKETVVKALGEPDSLIRDTPALKFPKFNRDPLF